MEAFNIKHRKIFMHSYEKLAKILRTDKDNLRLIDEQFGALTGKREVMDKIIEDNEFIIKNRLAALGLTKNSGAKEVYDALIKKLKLTTTNFLNYWASRRR